MGSYSETFLVVQWLRKRGIVKLVNWDTTLSAFQASSSSLMGRWNWTLHGQCCHLLESSAPLPVTLRSTCFFQNWTIE